MKLTRFAIIAVCIIHCTIAFDEAASSDTNDEGSLNSLPQAIRQTPPSMIQILNTSSVAAFQEEAIANASSTLSNTSFSDIENDNLTHSLQLKYRERKKQERIFGIQAQILHRLRMNKQPNISSILSEEEQRKIAMIFEKMQTVNNGHIELAAQGIPDPFMAMQRLQSFYPSCSLPNNTDKSLWESSETFRIYYDTLFNRQADITVMLAKLRLYKVTGNSDPNFVGWSSNQEVLPRQNQLETLINSRAANGINVSIFQFVKPVRANKREKKRLIDSRTIPVEYEGWVEFNVINSLNFWLHHSNKNFGFDVRVEDAFGNKLNPNFYFRNLNCSADSPQDTPFPNIRGLHPEMGENESSLFDNETYPTLDLQTAEIPRVFSEFDPLAGRLDRVIKKRSNRHHMQYTCQSNQVYVTFSEMALDNYILWPQGVLWTFCEGGCDSSVTSEDRRESFYATFMNRLFRIKSNESTSSCVATSQESLQVVLYDGQNTVFETVIEDVVPTSCGCRSR